MATARLKLEFITPPTRHRETPRSVIGNPRFIGRILRPPVLPFYSLLYFLSTSCSFYSRATWFVSRVRFKLAARNSHIVALARLMRDTAEHLRIEIATSMQVQFFKFRRSRGRFVIVRNILLASAHGDSRGRERCHVNSEIAIRESATDSTPFPLPPTFFCYINPFFSFSVGWPGWRARPRTVARA